MGGMDGFLERHPVWIVVVTLTGLLSVLIVIGGCAGGGVNHGVLELYFGRVVIAARRIDRGDDIARGQQDNHRGEAVGDRWECGCCAREASHQGPRADDRLQPRAVW